jgi:hypothetical protein
VPSEFERERTKLFAGSLDRASTSCFTVGVATPVAGLIYNVAAFGAALEWWRLALGVLGWLLVAIVLHYLARRVLRGLNNVSD